MAQRIRNITITNNNVEGQEGGAVRIRLFNIGAESGDRQPTQTVFDIEPGAEERVNIASELTGFEVRPIVPGSAYSSDDEVTADPFATEDAYRKLKAAVKVIPAIRADMTLTDTERDAKAGAAWSEALRLAQQ